jgi:acetylornithine/succinyldiaminopimelate/putrescine aminotransferase
MSFDDLAALDAEHVMQTYARLPVAFVRGEGSRLWDSEGREYLDFLGGLAVTSPSKPARCSTCRTSTTTMSSRSWPPS